MASGIKGNWTVTEREDGTGGFLEVANTVTAKKIVAEEAIELPGLVIDHHVHDAADIISGTFDPARLPAATDETAGAVIIGTGLTITQAGVLNFQARYGLPGGTDTQTGAGPYICVDGSTLQIDTDGEAKLAVKIKTAGGITHTAAGIEIDTATAKALLGLGSAAYLAAAAGTGTSADAGKVPVLDAGGKLAASAVPKIAITDTFTAVSEIAMLALPGAEKGDICVRTDIYRTFILTGDDATDINDWQELAVPTDLIVQVKAEVLAEIAETYVTTAALNTTLGGYVTTGGLSTALAGYVTTTALETALGGYVTTAALNTALAEYATTAAMNTALAGYVTTAALTVTLQGYSQTNHGHVVEPIADVPASGIISLTKNGGQYRRTITGNTVLGFDATGLANTDETITFELLVTTGARTYNVLFGPTISWLNGEQPLFQTPNTSYLMAFRSYDLGNTWVGAYQGQF